MEFNKRSLFFSAMQSFLKVLFGCIGLGVAIIPIIIIFSSLSIDKSYNMSIKNTLTILPDEDGNADMLPVSTPVILQISITGIIGKEDLNSSSIKSQLLESQKGLLKNERVKAILLYINSPGGGAVDSDNIYHLLKNYKEKYKVPVHAYIDGLCASGGMYIASSCDYISSSAVSVIGSVGVLSGPFFNFTDGLKRLGVYSYTFTQGKDKDMMNSFREWKESDKKCINNLLAYLYDRFVDIVTEARPQLSKEKLINEYGAQVFPAPTAKEYGYIDNGASSYDDALKNLLTTINLEDKPYQIIELRPKQKLFQALFKNKWTSLEKEFYNSIMKPHDREQVELFSYLYDPLSN